jgi:hypothetical protein
MLASFRPSERGASRATRLRVALGVSIAFSFSVAVITERATATLIGANRRPRAPTAALKIATLSSGPYAGRVNRESEHVEHHLALGTGTDVRHPGARDLFSPAVAIDYDLPHRPSQLNTSTVRATSPAFIARKASLMSSSRPRRVTISSSKSRP